jgi:hypothetical protein
MIDKNTGQLTISKDKAISPTTTLSEIKAFKLSDIEEECNLGNGWIHYTFKNVEAFAKFFHFTFYFFGENLKSIEFIINESPFDLNTGWDSWSEQREKENALLYNNWLNKEIGTVRNFTWGNVLADYDPKSGGSSIFIRYK